MIFFETPISDTVLGFFQENQTSLVDFKECNSIIKKASGINDFFTSQEQATGLEQKINEPHSFVSEPDRRAYGDFQTNVFLVKKITEYIFSTSDSFEFILEPTCGKGNFLIASIQQWQTLKKVVGVEIYQPYVWETKFNILDYFLSTEGVPTPEIDIIHANAFEFSYEHLAKATQDLKTLVIGNPPWVTNAELGSIDSKNLPRKTNFKKNSGLEAMTGKGNFDIGEYISLILLRYFEKHTGMFALLIKNSVVKNIIQEQPRNKFHFNRAEKLTIDSKKEFNVSVNACLFFTRLNNPPSFTCTEYDFYTHEPVTTFGWYKDKFVHSVTDYDKSSAVDGKSVFTWRSGVKHDCSKVMELERFNDHFKNGLGEEIHLESSLVYGLLKSSNLKKEKVSDYRKLTIITQQKIGQETSYIKNKYPLTYQYLNSHKDFFEKRKSSIYRGKPSFSIFGIGDYSFSTYKVAISGLYKSTHFTLVSSKEEKPIMLDDTCYFIGFEDEKIAEIAHHLTNSDIVQKFLQSIIFSDSKRSINKDTLMRIDFERAFEMADFKQASNEIKGLEIKDWKAFENMIKKEKNEQMALF